MKRRYQERESYDYHNTSRQLRNLEHVAAANVIRQMRRMVPNHGEISPDAIISIQECVSEFIRFMTSEANTRCREEMRTTITGEDVLIALNNHGFYRYIGPLFIYLNRFRQYGSDEHPSLRDMRGFVRDDHNDGPSGNSLP